MQAAKNIPDVGKTVFIENTSLGIEDTIKYINMKLRATTKHFIQAAVALQIVDHAEIYKEKGFNNIHEFALAEFKLSKNQTYNLLSVAKNFSSQGKLLDPYDQYSFSQLVEMVSLPEELHSSISPDTTVKEIRQIKKEIKEPKSSESPKSNIVNVEFKEVKPEIMQDIRVDGPHDYVQTMIDTPKLQEDEGKVERQTNTVEMAPEKYKNMFGQPATKDAVIANFETQVNFFQMQLNQARIDYDILNKECESLKSQVAKLGRKLEKNNSKTLEAVDKLVTTAASSKTDLSLALSLLSTAWSNETDDTKASELDKQIQFISQFNK